MKRANRTKSDLSYGLQIFLQYPRIKARLAFAKRDSEGRNAKARNVKMSLGCDETNVVAAISGVEFVCCGFLILRRPYRDTVDRYNGRRTFYRTTIKNFNFV